MNKITIDKEKFISICESSLTMARACATLDMNHNTFIRYAKKFGCYNPNQGHRGIKTRFKRTRIKTEDILSGKFPDYQTYKLKKRLIAEGIKKDGGEICHWSKKRFGDDYSTCELHHKDGNCHNHSLNNLIMLCPNCHSLTENYRSKNRAYK